MKHCKLYLDLGCQKTRHQIRLARRHAQTVVRNTTTTNVFIENTTTITHKDTIQTRDA